MMGVSWGIPKTTIGNFRLSVLMKPGGFLVVHLLTRKQWGFPSSVFSSVFNKKMMGVSWGFPKGFPGFPSSVFKTRK